MLNDEVEKKISTKKTKNVSSQSRLTYQIGVLRLE
jgi:hypothetical protein